MSRPAPQAGGASSARRRSREGPGPLPAAVRRFVEQAARSRVPALLEGETGTGKSYLARWIHNLGPRSAGPFVKVSCANLPEQLVDAELLGHERGAYTDAREARAGPIERAHGGTLFLDEIGELSPALQAKLLVFFDDGSVRRLGGTREIAVDVRVVAATNRKLEREVARGTFRRDLYHRCRGLVIPIPPLRRRRGDIPALVTWFLERIAEGAGGDGRVRVLEVEDAAMKLLQTHPWPGNVRQLELALAVTAAACEGGVIGVEHLPGDVRATGARLPVGADEEGEVAGAGRYVAAGGPGDERASIVRALRDEQGNRTRAARALGMSPSTLYTKIYRYAIEEEELTGGAERRRGREEVR